MHGRRTLRGRTAAAILAAMALVACTGDGGSGPDKAPGTPPDKPEEGTAGAASRLTAFTFEDTGGLTLSWDPGTGRLTAGGSTTTPEVLFIHVFQPDCGKCGELARALETVLSGAPDVAAAGITHRLGEQEARAFTKRTGITYPVAAGTGSPWAKRWSRGDPLYIAGPGGRIAYRQRGFRKDDVARWRAVVEDLRAGRPPRYTKAAREHLAAGDPLPAIELPDLMTGRSLTLRAGSRGMELASGGEVIRRGRASLGFFSRY